MGGGGAWRGRAARGSPRWEKRQSCSGPPIVAIFRLNVLYLAYGSSVAALVAHGEGEALRYITRCGAGSCSQPTSQKHHRRFRYSRSCRSNVRLQKLMPRLRSCAKRRRSEPRETNLKKPLTKTLLSKQPESLEGHCRVLAGESSPRPAARTSGRPRARPRRAGCPRTGCSGCPPPSPARSAGPRAGDGARTVAGGGRADACQWFELTQQRPTLRWCR